MKKILFSMIALLSMTIGAKADGLVVTNVGVQPGKTTSVQVALNATGDSYRAVLFTLVLPEGINIATDEYGDPAIVADLILASAGYNVTANILDDGSIRFGVMNTGSDTPIPSSCGSLFSFTIVANGSLSIGNMLTATLSDIKLTDVSAVDHQVDNTSFRVTVEEIRTILDENSTTAPEAAEGVNVRVLRSIKANQWSTICLPFAMTAAQTKEAFGEDVQLADFNGYETIEDNDENIVGINVKFNNATEIEANHPYMIKVSSPISEFTVDNVDIAPEEEPTVAAVKRTKKQWSEMIGTYTATTVDNQMLFLNNNQFWYSTGSSAIKGYRAYFDFYDVLTAVENAYSSRIGMVFMDEETGIKCLTPISLSVKGEGSIYSLDGRKVTSMRKGVYVKNNKKVVVK